MAIKKTVVSPAGETIELVRDDEWVNRSGVPAQSLRSWQSGNKRFLLAALWEHGQFTDPRGSGSVLRRVREYMRSNYGAEMGGPALSMLIKHDVNLPAFEIDRRRQKKTDWVRLVALPEMWYAKLMHTLETEINPYRREHGTAVTPEPPDEPPPLPVVPFPDEPESVATPTDQEWADITRDLDLDAPTEYEHTPALDLEIASTVAMSLLTQVVEIIHAGSPETTDARVRQLSSDVADISGKLAARLQENDVMRRQLRQAGDEIQALRMERDGLRTRLRGTEANLREVMKGDNARVVDEEVRKRVDQFMRARPTPKGKDDDE